MKKTALIVCGALAREVLTLKKKYKWDVDILGLPVLLHNTPGRIPPEIVKRIKGARGQYERLFVIYGDCGTSGTLDRLLAQEGVQRIAGPHCYEMYADGTFEDLMEEEPGTFFLTDFLVGSFDHLVLEGLGIDRKPQLRDDYFKNYRRVVYLAQREDPTLRDRAKWAADQLALPLEIRQVGYGSLEKRLIELMEG